MTTQSGVWKFADKLNPKINKKSRLILGEGDTPLDSIGQLHFKREDYNLTGSVKDRGMCFQISALLNNGHKEFVISSSGNAAISAAAYCQLAKVKLTIFVSSKINQHKFARLQSYPFKIIQTKRPVSGAHRYAKQHNAYNLRPSKDSLGMEGYKTIGFELQQQLPKCRSIFFPVSSANTLVGVCKVYEKNLPSIHAVQTTQTHQLAKFYDKNYIKTESSLANGLVAKSMPRLKQAKAIIDKSKGSGWVVSDQQIEYADKWLKQKQIETSYEGAAALAGYFKAKKLNCSLKYPIVIMLTGSI